VQKFVASFIPNGDYSGVVTRPDHFFGQFLDMLL
jgi:hypothetical protein